MTTSRKIKSFFKALVSCWIIFAWFFCGSETSHAQISQQYLFTVSTDKPGQFPNEDIILSLNESGEIEGFKSSLNPQNTVLLSDLEDGREFTLKKKWGVPLAKVSIQDSFTPHTGGTLVLSFRWNVTGSKWKTLSLNVHPDLNGQWTIHHQDAPLSNIQIIFLGNAIPKTLRIQ